MNENTKLLNDQLIGIQAAVIPEDDGTFQAVVLMGPYKTSEEAEAISKCMHLVINRDIYDDGKHPPVEGLSQIIGH